MSFSASLPDAAGDLWERATTHVFVRAVAEGSIEPQAFAAWIEQDYVFVDGLAGFVRRLVSTAPDGDRPGLQDALGALAEELDRFRAFARRESIVLGAEPVPTCKSYLDFLDDCATRGYATGVTAYYACERSYLESWSAIRTEDALAGRYGEWIDNWSSEGFHAFVRWLGERLDAATAGEPEAALDGLRSVFARTVEHELAFWDACWARGGSAC